MSWFYWSSFIVLAYIGFGAIFGAPYLPTRKRQIKYALELLDLKKGRTVVDMGCGDGRFLIAAAKQGLVAVGYEINPLVYMAAKLRTFGRSNVTVRYGDALRANLDDVDGVYVFLMRKRLNLLEKLLSKKQGLRVVSYAYQFKYKEHAKSEEGLFLYQY